MLKPRQVLVIGATRGTGSLIAQRLRDEGHRVRILARNVDRARAIFKDTAQIVRGDVTQPATLPPAIVGMNHLIFTAAVTHRPAGEALVKATVHDGVLHTISAARETGFRGRFMLMGALGTTRRSALSVLLNLMKGNTLRWRHTAEAALRASGLEYTIVHAGILVDEPGGRRPVEIGQSDYPMQRRYRIGRADVAEVFARALFHPSAGNATFDAVWARTGQAPPIEEQLERLRPDGMR